MGKILRNVKLMLVIPYLTLTAAGSYGSGLKDILESNENFLGISNFKDNIVIIITFAPRMKLALEEVIKNIKFCMNHADGKLSKYSELLMSVIEKGRIRLFPQPNMETDDGTFDIPNF